MHDDTVVDPRTRDSFTPHVVVENRVIGFRWDGLVYDGSGTVDGTTAVHYMWVDDVITHIAPWERYELGDIGPAPKTNPRYLDYVLVSRELTGYHVFKVWRYTPEQLELRARAHKINLANPNTTPRDGRGTVLDIDAWHAHNARVNQLLKDAGCDRDALRESIKTFPPENFVGYFFTDGLEQSEQEAWSGGRALLAQKPADFQAWVASVPLVED